MEGQTRALLLRVVVLDTRVRANKYLNDLDLTLERLVVVQRRQLGDLVLESLNFLFLALEGPNMLLDRVPRRVTLLLQGFLQYFHLHCTPAHHWATAQDRRRGMGGRARVGSRIPGETVA